MGKPAGGLVRRAGFCHAGGMADPIQVAGGASGSRPVWPWLLVLAWTGLILLTIPVARRFQDWLEVRGGLWAYPALIVLGVGAGGAVLLGRILRAPPGRRCRMAAGLAVAGGAAAWIGATQLQAPVEAVHFIEYGVLALVLFRAWRQPAPDVLAYPLSWLSAGLVAWLDEFLQWLMPGRFWDYRDLRLNLLAAGLVLAAIAWILRPAGIARAAAVDSRRWLLWLAWTLWLALGFSLACTPARVDGLAARCAPLDFLYNNESVMTEFGHRHQVPGLGTFHSRFSLAELHRRDAEGGDRAGAGLRTAGGLLEAGDFRRRFPASADPFLHEAAGHLRRRDHYYAAAWQYRETDPARMADHLAVAWGENRILELYFPRTLAAAQRQWPAERLAACRTGADPAAPFASGANGHLITGLTEAQAWLLWLAGAGGLWAGGRKGRPPDRHRGSLLRRPAL